MLVPRVRFPAGAFFLAPIRTSGLQQKYFVPGLNWGPLACEASVITTRPTKLLACDRTNLPGTCPQQTLRVIRTPGIEPGTIRCLLILQSNALPTELCSGPPRQLQPPREQARKQQQIKKKQFTLLDLCVSSLRRGHANLLCIVPILSDDPKVSAYQCETTF